MKSSQKKKKKMKRNRDKEEDCERSKTLKPHRNLAREFPDVPSEVVEEILQNLPGKSLIRFKSVSKQWRSTIESHEFVERHMIRQKSRVHKILVISSLGDPCTNLSVESIPIEEGKGIDTPYTLSDQFSNRLQGLESCDGLVCTYGMNMIIHILNPVTGELRRLPPAEDAVESRKMHTSLVGFGRDIVTGTYKVVRIFHWFGFCKENSALCNVFDLNMDHWRHVSTVPYCVYPEQKPIYACGTLYLIVGESMLTREKILALDLHTEKFHLVQHPDCLFEKVVDPMFALKNCLCVLKRNLPWEFDIWAMAGGDDGHERWGKIFSFSLHSSHIDDRKYFYRYIKPLTLCHEKGRLVVRMHGDVVVLNLRKRDHCIVRGGRKGAMTAYAESLISPFK